MRILLNTGAYAVLTTPGSGTQFTFTYTVVAENTSDLTYASVNALDGVEGAISEAHDANWNMAVLTLPAPSVFADAHAIVIDTIAPTIENVAMYDVSGDGNIDKVEVTFSELIEANAAGMTFGGTTFPVINTTDHILCTLTGATIPGTESVNMTYTAIAAEDYAGNTIVPGEILAANIADMAAPVIEGDIIVTFVNSKGLGDVYDSSNDVKVTFTTNEPIDVNATKVAFDISPRDGVFTDAYAVHAIGTTYEYIYNIPASFPNLPSGNYENGAVDVRVTLVDNHSNAHAPYDVKDAFTMIANDIATTITDHVGTAEKTIKADSDPVVVFGINALKKSKVQ